MAFDRIEVTKKNSIDGTVPMSPPSATSDFHLRSTVMPNAPQVNSNSPTTLPRRPVKEGNLSMSISSLPAKTALLGLVVVLVLGIGSGAMAAFLTTTPASGPESVEQGATAQQVENAVKVGAIFGVADEKTFRDDTEGVLIKGGLDGEGSHTLLRPGGISQNVYLTSSVVELDQFDSMKVKIWGETFKGQKAGWLMDVGRLEVVELTAEKPTWYTEEK